MTVVLLAEALIDRGELEAAAARLEKALWLARAAENARDLRSVRRVVDVMRRRWRDSREVRRLDQLLWQHLA